MASSVPQARGSGADIEPIVVVLRDVQVTGILRRVVVAVANEGRLPVIMQIRIGDGDPLTGVGDVDQSIVVVFAVGEVGVELAVVNPDVGRLLDSDTITVGRKNVLADDVANNDVCLLPDKQANTGQL